MLPPAKSSEPSPERQTGSSRGRAKSDASPPADRAEGYSENLFRIMSEECPGPMWLTDAGGKAVFINQAYRPIGSGC